MAYDKEKSGDPDFDDKVPPAEHNTVVTGGDGQVIGRLTESTGPTTPTGAHLNVEVDQDDLDTRPAPGGVAETKAEVQTYDAEDVPSEKISADDLKNAQPSDEAQNRNSGDAVAEANRADAAAVEAEAAAEANRTTAAKVRKGR